MRFGCFFQEINSREPQVDSREQEKASLNALMHRMHTKSIFAQYSEFTRPFLSYFCSYSKNPTRRLLRRFSAVQLMFWHSGGLGRVQEVPGGGSWRCGVRMARWFPCSRAPNDGEPPKSIFLANASGHHFCTYPSYTGVPRGFLCRMFFLFLGGGCPVLGECHFLYLQSGTCIAYRALTQKQSPKKTV